MQMAPKYPRLHKISRRISVGKFNEVCVFTWYGTFITKCLKLTFGEFVKVCMHVNLSKVSDKISHVISDFRQDECASLCEVSSVVTVYTGERRTGDTSRSVPDSKSPPFTCG